MKNRYFICTSACIPLDADEYESLHLYRRDESLMLMRGNDMVGRGIVLGNQRNKQIVKVIKKGSLEYVETMLM